MDDDEAEAVAEAAFGNKKKVSRMVFPQSSRIEVKAADLAVTEAGTHRNETTGQITVSNKKLLEDIQALQQMNF